MGRTLPPDAVMACHIWAEVLTDASTGRPNLTAIAEQTGLSHDTVGRYLRRPKPTDCVERALELRASMWVALRYAILQDVGDALRGIARRFANAAQEDSGIDARDTKFLADALSIHLRTTALLSGDVTSRTHRQEEIKHAHTFEVVQVPERTKLEDAIEVVYGLIGDPQPVPEHGSTEHATAATPKRAPTTSLPLLIPDAAQAGRDLVDNGRFGAARIARRRDEKTARSTKRIKVGLGKVTLRAKASDTRAGEE